EFDVNHQLVHQQVSTVKTSELPILPGDEREVNGYVAKGQEALSQIKVAVLPEEYANLTTQMRDALQAIAAVAGTDLAVLNTGLFVRNLQPGLLTMNDLHEVLPHPMHVVRVKLS